MNHPVVWFEVVGRDGKKLRQFYGELFDWQFNVLEKGDYGLVAAEKGQLEGGIGTVPQGDGWTTFYVKVDDIEAAVKRAEKLGAQLLMPIERLPDVTVAVLRDPEGHPIGLAQPRGS